jgi:hypothetical protein
MAGTRVGEAWYSIRADDAPLRSAVTRAEADIKASGTRAGTGFSNSFGTGITKIKTALSGMLPLIGALGAAFVATKIVGFFGEAIGAASDLGETVSKVGVIFGREFGPQLEEWAEGAAQAFGMSKQQALDAAATFATFGKSAGLAGDDLVGFSTELVALASDLASFHNAEPQEVIDALGAALRGEAEPMRRFGVLLDDATLRNRAFEMGIISTTKNALTPQQKVLAAQAEILIQTSDAQGDFARTSDGLANQQRILSAELANVTAEIGQMLLPVMVELAHFAVDVLVPALRGAIDFIKDMATEVGKNFDHIGDMLNRWAIQWGDMGKGIEETAQAAGHDVVEFKNLVIQGMNEMNMELDEAERYAAQTLSGIPLSMTDAARNSLTAWKQADLGGMVGADLEAGAPAVGAGADVMAGEIPEAVGEAGEEAAAIARDIPGDLSDAILQGAEDLDPVRDMIEEILAGSVSDAVTLAENAATFANPGIARGLQSNSTESRQAMLHDVVEPLTESINTLGPTALLTGEGIPDNLKDGVFRNRDLAIDEVARMRDDIAPEMDLADFAEQHGIGGVAALIRGMQTMEHNAKVTAGAVASRAVNEMGVWTPGAARHGANAGAGYTGGVGAYNGTAYTKGHGVGFQAVAGMKVGGAGAYSGGSSLGASFMKGITSAIAAANPELNRHLNYVRMQLGGSLPEEGPLKGDTAEKGGRSVGSTWVTGLASELGKATRAIGDPLRAIGMGPAALSTHSGLLGGGTSFSGGINIVVNVARLDGAADVDALSQRLATGIRLRARSVF